MREGGRGGEVGEREGGGGSEGGREERWERGRERGEGEREEREDIAIALSPQVHQPW